MLAVGLEMDECHERVASAFKVKEKIVGLQLGCRQKLNTLSSLTWDKSTGTAILRVQFRVRAISKCGERWKFRDDAGSGTRGRASDFCKFRFSAQLNDLMNCQQTCAHTFIQVWSKGNCPAVSRKGYSAVCFFAAFDIF
jgi:hypothetical protein